MELVLRSREQGEKMKVVVAAEVVFLRVSSEVVAEALTECLVLVAAEVLALDLGVVVVRPMVLGCLRMVEVRQIYLQLAVPRRAQVFSAVAVVVEDLDLLHSMRLALGWAAQEADSRTSLLLRWAEVL